MRQQTSLGRFTISAFIMPWTLRGNVSLVLPVQIIEQKIQPGISQCLNKVQETRSCVSDSEKFAFVFISHNTDNNLGDY